MALQILEEIGLGERLGSSLGTGIRGIFQQMAKEQKNISGLKGLGFSDEEASQLSGFPDPIIQQIVKQRQENLRQQQATQIEQMSEDEISQYKKAIADSLASNGDSSALGGLAGLAQDLGQAADVDPLEGTEKEAFLGPKQIVERIRSEVPSKIEMKKERTAEANLQRTIKEREKVLRKKLTASTRKALQEEQNVDQARLDKIKLKREDVAEKITKKLAGDAAANANLIDILDEQLELNLKGEVNNPGFLALLENLGIGDIESLKSGDTVKFVKNNSVFFKQLKEIFGGNVSNTEVEQFMKFLANPKQSPAQRHSILLGFKKQAEAKNIWRDAIDEVIEENEGIPPSATRLESLALKKVRPQLKKLSADFKKILKEADIPEGESKLKTAALSLGSKALASGGKKLAQGIGIGGGAKVLQKLLGF